VIRLDLRNREAARFGGRPLCMSALGVVRLRRDHIADHARAVGLYERAVMHEVQIDAELWRRDRLASPENSPEAARPESRKSL